MNFLVFFCAVFKNVIYGLTVFFVGSLSDTVDVLDILALRYIVSFVFLLLLKITGIIKINIRLRDLFTKGSSVRTVFLAGLFEPCLYMFFEHLGISMTSAITAGVIISLAPAVSIFAEELILKEKAGIVKKLFLIIGIIGAIYIAFMSGSGETAQDNSVFGIISLFLSLFSGCCFACFSRKSSKTHSAMEVTYITAFMGAIAFNTVNVIRHIINGTLSSYFIPFLSLENIICFVFLSIISTVFATAMNNYALGKVPVTTISGFSGISTLVTVLAGVIMGGETIYYYHIIGFSLILIRMIGVNYLEIKGENSPHKKN